MASNRPPSWEYHVAEPPRDPSQKEARNPSALLNDVADDGWELDETIDYVGGGTKFLVFRRPTAEAETEADHE